MKIVQPKPFTFEAGKRAVLLLHAFTGDSADVRMLGRYLQEKNYTTHAPIYRGHGGALEEIAKTSATDWWEDVLAAYDHLKSLGYEEIAVAGLSLGGVLALKLAATKDIKGIATLATPIFFDNKDRLLVTFKGFAKQYKQFEQKSPEVIKQEIDLLMDKAPKTIDSLEPLIQEVDSSLNKIDKPALIVQPVKDQLINTDSASYIYEHISSREKELLWYEKSQHVVTTGVERERLHEDVYTFLESLPWTV
ncbi:MAG TPA: alpha/beta fold hydrolase [Bacillota bacterium]|nr:alpha/beta fold hydrolase [Bacillota bacterium]